MSNNSFNLDDVEPISDFNGNVLDELDKINEDNINIDLSDTKSKPKGRGRPKSKVKVNEPSKASTTQSPMFNEEPPVDIQERLICYNILQTYKSCMAKKLGPYLDLITMDHLKELTTEELKNMVEEVRVQVAIAGSGNFVQNAVGGVATVVENVGPFVGLDLTGLAQACEASEDLKETAVECYLEYGFTYVSPQKRLLINFLNILKTVHNYNRQLAMEKLHYKVDPNLEQKYNDI